MNKLLTKIVGTCLGLSMAIGVGVAVAANNKDAMPVYASVPSDVTITFNQASGSTDSGSAYTTSSTIANVANGTPAFSGISDTAKAYAGKTGTGLKFGTSSAVGYIGFNLASGYQDNLKSIKVTVQQYGSDSGNVILKTGSTSNTWSTGSTQRMTITPSSSSSTNYDTYTFSTPSTIGRIWLGTSSKRAYVTEVVLHYEENTNPAVNIDDAPEYLIDGGESSILCASITNDNSYIITWTASPSTGVTISPTTSSSNGEVNISFDGVTTGTTPIAITATINDGNSTNASINIYALEHAGTSSDPFTATDAQVFNGTSYLNKNGGDWYVEGYIVGEFYNSSSVLKGYYIDESPTATSSTKFELYNFTNNTGKPIIVADGTNTPSYVVAHGPMGTYASQPELSTSTFVSVDNGNLPSVVINEGNQSIFMDDELTFTATTENPDDAVVTWSSSVPTVATIDASTGIVTTVGGGTTTITATITVDSEDYSASVTLEVTAPLLTVGDNVIFYYDTNYLTDINTSGSTHYGNCATTKGEAVVYSVQVGSADNSFAFVNSGNYLTWSSGNSLDYANSVSSSSSWLITGDSLTSCTITNVGTSTRLLKYNSGSPRFACYESGQNAVSIEKVVVADPTTLTMDTKTMSLETEEVAADALTFTTDSPSAAFNWYSEDTSKATVSNGVVTAGTQTDVNVKIYVWFDSDGSGDFDPNDDLNDYCTVTITAPIIDYSSVSFGGIGTLVDSLDDLKAGDKIIFSDSENSDIAGPTPTSSGVIAASSATFSIADSKLYIGNGTAEVDALILTVDTYNSSTGVMTLKHGDKWLVSSAVKKCHLGDTAFDWTLSFESTQAILTSSRDAADTMQYNYNSGNARFAPYASTQTAINIWRVVEYTDEAFEYAETFLKGDGSSNTCAATITNWTSLGNTYTSTLSDGAKNIFKAATHSAPETYTNPTDYSIQHCVARYDDALLKHTELRTNEFMGREAAGTLSYSPNISVFEMNNTDNAVTIIAIISVISVSAIGGFFFFRKRKEQ